MLSINAANKSLQGHLKLSSAIQPSLMHAIARAINIAAPNPLEAHQDIATKLRTQLLQLIGEPDRRARRQMRDRSKRPFVSGPIVGRDELRFVAKIDHPPRQPF